MQNSYTTYSAHLTTITYAVFGCVYRPQPKPDVYIPSTGAQPSVRAAWEQMVRRMAEHGIEEIEFKIQARATTILPRREICNVLRGSRVKAPSEALKASRMALSEIYGASQNRLLTAEEDSKARRLIKLIHAEMRAIHGQPAFNN